MKKQFYGWVLKAFVRSVKFNLNFTVYNHEILLITKINNRLFGEQNNSFICLSNRWTSLLCVRLFGFLFHDKTKTCAVFENCKVIWINIHRPHRANLHQQHWQHISNHQMLKNWKWKNAQRKTGSTEHALNSCPVIILFPYTSKFQITFRKNKLNICGWNCKLFLFCFSITTDSRIS